MQARQQQVKLQLILVFEDVNSLSTSVTRQHPPGMKC